MSQVLQFNRTLVSSLKAGGVLLGLDHFFICPHEPADHCQCRKPKPGLIHSAARELNLDLRRSFLVGDAETDIGAGRAAGVLTILLNRERRPTDTRADWMVHGMTQVADLIQRVDVPESSELLYR
jgi:D-glycero-D-manno-heptose 1,7-bisphosphate phosphatase